MEKIKMGDKVRFSYFDKISEKEIFGIGKGRVHYMDYLKGIKDNRIVKYL